MQISQILTDNDIFLALIDIINKAQRTIDFMTFKLDLKQGSKRGKINKIFEALQAAQNRGIKIRAQLQIGHNSIGTPHTNHNAARILTETGIETRHPTGERIQHAKLFIIDNEIVLIGSHNLSNKSFEYNCEVSILFYDKKISENLTRYFEHTWGMGSQL